MANKLGIVAIVLERKLQQQQAAYRSCQLTLSEKRQEIAKLEALRDDYRQQVNGWNSGNPHALKDRIALVDRIQSMLMVLEHELGKLTLVEANTRSQVMSLLREQRAIQRVSERREAETKLQAKRRERAHR